MNTQKYLISSIVAAIFFFFYGYVVYDMLFADYIAKISPPGMMGDGDAQSILYIGLGCLLQALGLGLIYVRGHEGKGAMEGVRFGFLVGIFIFGIYFIWAGVSPMSLRAAITYGILDTVMYMGGGVCFAMLYKK